MTHVANAAARLDAIVPAFAEALSCRVEAERILSRSHRSPLNPDHLVGTDPRRAELSLVGMNLVALVALTETPPWLKLLMFRNTLNEICLS